jgi:hypothetical protein
MHERLQAIVSARLKTYGIGRSGPPNIAEALSAVVLNSNGNKCDRMYEQSCMRANSTAGSYLQKGRWEYLPASRLKMDCSSNEPFIFEVTNAPAFSLANGFYVATTTVHLKRTVYLKVTAAQLESFPQDLIPETKFVRMKASATKDDADRLLVPTDTGYCIQTLIGMQLLLLCWAVFVQVQP